MANVRMIAHFVHFVIVIGAKKDHECETVGALCSTTPPDTAKPMSLLVKLTRFVCTRLLVLATESSAKCSTRPNTSVGALMRLCLRGAAIFSEQQCCDISSSIRQSVLSCSTMCAIVDVLTVRYSLPKIEFETLYNVVS